MQLGSVEFIAFLLVLTLVTHGYDHPAWRTGVLAVANLLCLYTFASTPPQQLLVVVMLVSSYAIARLFQLQHLRGPWALAGCIALWAFGWATIRQPGPGLPASAQQDALALVGFSYFMFKHIHVCIDASQEAIPRLRPVTYFNYMAGFYTWAAGPIQRFPDFANQLEADGGQPTRNEVLVAVNRILNGYIKAFVLAAWVAPYADPAGIYHNGELTGWLLCCRLFAVYFGYYVFLYLNFSGYCDLAIGTAAMLGLRLPENFNSPFLARNPLEFWQRWHITLSEWLRDYVFTPLYRALRTHFAVLGLAGAALAYLVTFGIAGLWHGPTPNYLLFGLLHGVAAAGYTIGNALISRWVERERLRRFRAHFGVRALGMVLCNTYVALTMLVFGWPMEKLNHLVQFILARWAA